MVIYVKFICFLHGNSFRWCFASFALQSNNSTHHCENLIHNEPFLFRCFSFFSFYFCAKWKQRHKRHINNERDAHREMLYLLVNFFVLKIQNDGNDWCGKWHASNFKSESHAIFKCISKWFHFLKIETKKKQPAIASDLEWYIVHF